MSTLLSEELARGQKSTHFLDVLYPNLPFEQAVESTQA